MDEHITKGSTFLHPENILAKAGVVTGDVVVDIGCGGGYFVIAAARMIGDEGMAYGIDLLKPALSTLDSKAKTFGLTNIRTVWSDAEVFGGAKEIKNGSANVVLLTQLFSQAKKHKEIFDEASRMLKKGGIAVVVDWQNNGLKFGPAAEDCMSKETLIEYAKEKRFVFKREIEAGPYHYGLIFEKS